MSQTKLIKVGQDQFGRDLYPLIAPTKLDVLLYALEKPE